MAGNARKKGHYHAYATARMKQLEGVELASFQARAFALVVDFALASIVFVGALVALFIALNKIPIIARNDRHITIELDFFHNWYSIIYLVLFMGLTLYVGKGRTIGKRVMRIRVVSVAHPRLSLWHCLEQTLGYGASALELGFGFMQYFTHPNYQTVHDRIAETIVIRDMHTRRIERSSESL